MNQFSFVLCEWDVMQFCTWETFSVKLTDPFHFLLKARHYYSLNDHWLFQRVPGGAQIPFHLRQTPLPSFFLLFREEEGRSFWHLPGTLKSRWSCNSVNCNIAKSQVAKLKSPKIDIFNSVNVVAGMELKFGLYYVPEGPTIENQRKSQRENPRKIKINWFNGHLLRPCLRSNFHAHLFPLFPRVM